MANNPEKWPKFKLCLYEKHKKSAVDKTIATFATYFPVDIVVENITLSKIWNHYLENETE